MRPEFITVGTVVNAHGVRGEVKVNPAGFDPAFIAAFRTLYIGGVETKVTAARVHKSTVLLTLPGVDTMDGALALKGRSVAIRRCCSSVCLCTSARACGNRSGNRRCAAVTAFVA